MFERLIAHLTGTLPFETPLPPADAQHALAALLVRAAKADKSYLFVELQQIDRILAAHYNLNPVEAAKLRAESEKLEADMATEDLAAILRDAVDLAERERLVGALWTIVFADGIERPSEDVVLHQIEAVLGVSPEVSKRLHDAAQNAAG